MINDVRVVLNKLTEKLAWGVSVAHGSHIFIEFGNPSLEVREPRKGKALLHASEKVKANFERRRVTLKGEYTLIVLDCFWTIRLQSGAEISSDGCAGEWHDVFFYLDGQRLDSVSTDNIDNSCTLHFDLGAELYMRPSPSEEVAPQDDQWILEIYDSHTISYSNSGVLSVE